MKLRLPDRMSERGGWIAVASLSAPFVLAVGLPIVAFAVWLPVSLYLTVWRAGYGLGCSTHTISETTSPSGRWTARARRVRCFTISHDPATNQWVQVVLISNDRPRLFARYREAFYRYLGDERPSDGARLAVKWIDDYALEVDTPPCEPPCQKLDDQTRLLVPTGANPCDASCRSEKRVASITVAVKPPAD